MKKILCSFSALALATLSIQSYAIDTLVCKSQSGSDKCKISCRGPGGDHLDSSAGVSSVTIDGTDRLKIVATYRRIEGRVNPEEETFYIGRQWACQFMFLGPTPIIR